MSSDFAPDGHDGHDGHDAHDAGGQEPPPEAPADAMPAPANGDPTGSLPEALAETDLLKVEGERLGVPIGATRNVADYGQRSSSYVFLAVVSICSLGLDIVTKAWAATKLDSYPGLVEVWPKYVTFVLAKNRGGAWGLLQTTSENVRRPFFLLVSLAAIAFIMTLYRRLQPRQRALKWGLPLVLGGALGNVFDRVRYGHVIDFIDVHYKEKYHWPTFNVADVAICVGVGLMALDMFFSKRGHSLGPIARRVPPAQSGEPVPGWGRPPPAAEGPPADLDTEPSTTASSGS
jgi:signal peptidase II